MAISLSAAILGAAIAGTVYILMLQNLRIGVSHLRVHSRTPASAQAAKFAMTSAGADERAAQVLEYWFGEDWATAGKYKIAPERMSTWFGGGPAVDELIKSKFGETHKAMGAGSLDSWLEHPANALAGVILIDQFSRNMFRGSAQTYALDDKALSWAKHILDTKLCDDLPAPQRFFLYMPFDHSEVLEDQHRCVALNKELLAEAKAAVAAGDQDAVAAAKFFKQTIDYAIAHMVVVEKWGRFPHRNVILGRESTPEEIAGLADGTIRSF